jgi:hypothetical protein
MHIHKICEIKRIVKVSHTTQINRIRGNKTLETNNNG